MVYIHYSLKRMLKNYLSTKLGEKSTNNFVHHLVMVSVGMFFTNLKQYTTTYQQIIIWTSW